MSQFTGGTIGSYSRLWLIITGAILLGVGAILAIMGAVDAVFAPKMLRKLWEQQDREQR